MSRMYLKIVLITLFCQIYPMKNSLILQNSNLSKCLHTLLEYFLKTDENTMEQQSLYSIIRTITDYLPYSEPLYFAIVKSETTPRDQLSIFNMYKFNKDFESRGIHDFNIETLLVRELIKRRVKMGILHIKNNEVEFINNFRLDSTKICTTYFYEKCKNCCTKLIVTKHNLSKRHTLGICSVRVAWVRTHLFVEDTHRKHNPGLMVSFLNVFQEKREVKVIFQKDNSEYQEEFLSNGTFFKLHKDLLAGKHDVAVGPLFMNSTQDVPFNYGPVFFKDYYYLILRKRPKITSYKKLTFVFTVEVWKWLSLTFLVVTFLYFLFNIALEPHKQGLVTIMLNVYRQSLSQCIPSSTRSISLRLLFICYAIFSINIDTAYLGTLSSVLTDTPYVNLNPEDAFRDVISMQIDWIAERLCKIMFVFRRQAPWLLNGSRILNDTDENMLKRVAYTQQNSTAIFLSTMVSYPYEASLVESFEATTAYLTLFVTFYIRQDFHLKESLQFWACEMFEKGFFSKWTKDIIGKNNRGRSHDYQHVVREKKEAISLKMQHFQEIFKILFFGNAAATVVLILEFVYAWLDCRFRVTKKIKFVFGLLIPPPMYS